MFDLELINTNENNNPDECSPECLPFEENLDNELKDVQGKTLEELEKQWTEENEKNKIKSEDYIEHLENIKSDLLNNNCDNEYDEYSSGEEIPTCNPWRE